MRPIFLAAVLAIALSTGVRAAMGAPVLGGFAGVMLVALACVGALVMATDRDAFLPFLGPAVFPPGALLESHPDGEAFEVSIPAPRGAIKVVYWAASPHAGPRTTDWKTAYGAYENSGVAAVDPSGVATIRVLCPGQYSVPMKGTLPKHVHYRFVFPTGMTSSVHTKNLACM